MSQTPFARGPCNTHSPVRCIVEGSLTVSSKVAALLVLILAGGTVRPLACAWMCAPDQAVHESCHEPTPATGGQLSNGTSCDFLVDATGTATKPTSLERMAFVPVRIAMTHCAPARVRLFAPLTLGGPPRAAALPISILRI